MRRAAAALGACTLLVVVAVWISSNDSDESFVRRLVAHPPHKPFLPLAKQDVIGLGLSTLGLIIAAGGGIGGGGIIVPLYMLILGFRPKHAIPLSNVTILGGALANAIFNCPKRHPTLDRPVIDWDMILIMEPSTIAGAVLGSFLSKFLPDLVLTVSLTFILAFMGYRTLEKGVKLHAKEEQQLADGGTELGPLSGNRSGSSAESDETEELTATPRDDSLSAPSARQLESELTQLRRRERRTNWAKVSLLTVCFAGTIALTLLKGSGSYSPLGLECGTPLFWVVSFATVPWVIAFAALFRFQLLAETERKNVVGYVYAPQDIEWNEETTVRYPLLCTFAGLFAGLFGVGGGIVKGPLMLEMGVQPAVAAATAATMILYTTAAATVSFAVFGLLNYDYAVPLFLLGFFATIVGQVGLNACAGNRQAPIVFSIGCVIALSSLLVGVESWSHAAAAASWAEIFEVSSICSPGEA